MGSFAGRGQPACFIFHCYAKMRGGNLRPPCHLMKTVAIFRWKLSQDYSSDNFLRRRKICYIRTPKFFDHRAKDSKIEEMISFRLRKCLFILLSYYAFDISKGKKENKQRNLVDTSGAIYFLLFLSCSFLSRPLPDFLAFPNLIQLPPRVSGSQFPYL